MTATPIFRQLARELGAPLSPIAMLQSMFKSITGTIEAICGTAPPDSPPAELFGPLPRPLVLEEPIYDSVVHDIGYPHCSPTEALVTFTGSRWSAISLRAQRWNDICREWLR